MSKIFFTPKVSLAVSEVKSVVIHNTCRMGASNKITDRHPVRLVINQAHVFIGDEGLEAIESLLECGFYTSEMYELTKAHYEERLRQEALVYGPFHKD